MKEKGFWGFGVVFLTSIIKSASLMQQHTTMWSVTTGLLMPAASVIPLPYLRLDIVFNPLELYSGKISLPHLPITTTLSRAAMIAIFLS